MKIDTIDYFIGDELEPLQLWWTANGSLIDFSITHTYTLKVAPISNSSTSFTKTTLISGSVGSGTKQSGTPNLTVQWATTGELNNLADAGMYVCQIVAVRQSDGRERTGKVLLNMQARLQ